MSEHHDEYDSGQTATLSPPADFVDPALGVTEDETVVSEETGGETSEREAVVSEETGGETSEREAVVSEKNRMETSERERIVDEQVVGQIGSSSTTWPIHKINGVSFLMELEEGFIFLTHEEWSLTGVGETLIAAEQDLRANAKALAQVYLGRPVTDMTPDAILIRDFILSVVG